MKWNIKKILILAVGIIMIDVGSRYMLPTTLQKKNKKNHAKVNVQNRSNRYDSLSSLLVQLPQNASSCLLHESAVLEQVWLCQPKHPMLVADGAKNVPHSVVEIQTQVVIMYLTTVWFRLLYHSGKSEPEVLYNLTKTGSDDQNQWLLQTAVTRGL